MEIFVVKLPTSSPTSSSYPKWAPNKHWTSCMKPLCTMPRHSALGAIRVVRPPTSHSFCSWMALVLRSLWACQHEVPKTVTGTLMNTHQTGKIIIFSSLTSLEADALCCLNTGMCLQSHKWLTAKQLCAGQKNKPSPTHWGLVPPWGTCPASTGQLVLSNAYTALFSFAPKPNQIKASLRLEQSQPLQIIPCAPICLITHLLLFFIFFMAKPTELS